MAESTKSTTTKAKAAGQKATTTAKSQATKAKAAGQKAAATASKRATEVAPKSAKDAVNTVVSQAFSWCYTVPQVRGRAEGRDVPEWLLTASGLRSGC